VRKKKEESTIEEGEFPSINKKIMSETSLGTATWNGKKNVDAERAGKRGTAEKKTEGIQQRVVRLSGV